jgi:hypothetical protein
LIGTSKRRSRDWAASAELVGERHPKVRVAGADGAAGFFSWLDINLKRDNPICPGFALRRQF